MQKQVNTNKEHDYKKLSSITPSGFFGNSADNIVELKNFLTEEEKERKISYMQDSSSTLENAHKGLGRDQTRRATNPTISTKVV